MRKTSLFEILESISLFANFSRDEIAELIPLLVERKFPKGSRVINRGETGDSMFVIKDGEVTIWSDNNTNLGNLPAGSFFGELALIDRLPRSATVECVEESVVYELSKNAFDPLIAANISISNKFYSNCLHETFKRFRNIVTNFTFSQSNLREKTAALDEISKDLQHAARMQRLFIGTDFLDSSESLPGGIRRSYLYKPCIEVGGDFINVRKINDSLVSFLIADVSGHGVSAAMITGVLKSAFTIYSESFSDKPALLIKTLNRHLSLMVNSYFATCFYAVVDVKNKLITMAKAGHPYPLFWRKNKGTFEKIDVKGVALGIVDDAEYGEFVIDYSPGDKLLFFTDGIIEQTNAERKMYGENLLSQSFINHMDKTSHDILENLFADMSEYSENKPIDDDITLLMCEF